MEAVIDVRFAIGFLMPLVEPLAQGLAEALHREIDDRGRAAPGSRRRASGKVVGGEGAAEGQLHVGVDVDRPGHHVAPLGIDRLVGFHLEAVTDRRDLFPIDQHIGFGRVARGHHRPVSDQGLHGSSLTRSW